MISLMHGLLNHQTQKGIVVARAWEEWDVGYRVQIFSYKMNKFWGSEVQNGH
jgi:hypothetical protein